MASGRGRAARYTNGVQRLAFVLLAIGCTSSPGRPSAAVDAASDVDDAIVITEPAPTDRPPVMCPALNVKPAATTSLVQPFCDPTFANEADCPATAPEPGTACPRPMRCAYERSAGGFSGAACEGTWTLVTRDCGKSCDAPPITLKAIPPVAACGSQPEIDCGNRTDATDQEAANRQFNVAAQCCGAPSENSVFVKLEDGCAVSFAFARGEDTRFIECFARLFAGRRLSCAKNLTCLTASWSTLK